MSAHLVWTLPHAIMWICIWYGILYKQTCTNTHPISIILCFFFSLLSLLAFNPHRLNCFSINCSSFKVSWRWLIVDSSTQTHSISNFFPCPLSCLFHSVISNRKKKKWEFISMCYMLCAMCVLLLKCELELYSFQLLSYVKKEYFFEDCDMKLFIKLNFLMQWKSLFNSNSNNKQL